jgi:hypothetical protein
MALRRYSLPYSNQFLSLVEFTPFVCFMCAHVLGKGTRDVLNARLAVQASPFFLCAPPLCPSSPQVKINNIISTVIRINENGVS